MTLQEGGQCARHVVRPLAVVANRFGLIQRVDQQRELALPDLTKNQRPRPLGRQTAGDVAKPAQEKRRFARIEELITVRWQLGKPETHRQMARQYGAAQVLDLLHGGSFARAGIDQQAQPFARTVEQECFAFFLPFNGYPLTFLRQLGRLQVFPFQSGQPRSAEWSRIKALFPFVRRGFQVEQPLRRDEGTLLGTPSIAEYCHRGVLLDMPGIPLEPGNV
jgi:hypothetical protein